MTVEGELRREFETKCYRLLVVLAAQRTRSFLSRLGLMWPVLKVSKIHIFSKCKTA